MAKPVQPTTDEVEHATLKFDLNNPRFSERFSAEPDALRFLIKNADVDELVTSIQSSGWVDFEPLVVDRKSSVVLEGNRRLAALRLMSDPALRDKLGYELPLNGGKNPPDRITVKFVSSRDEARSYIAFKHINGPYK